MARSKFTVVDTFNSIVGALAGARGQVQLQSKKWWGGVRQWCADKLRAVASRIAPEATLVVSVPVVEIVQAVAEAVAPQQKPSKRKPSKRKANVVKVTPLKAKAKPKAKKPSKPTTAVAKVVAERKPTKAVKGK